MLTVASAGHDTRLTSQNLGPFLLYTLNRIGLFWMVKRVPNFGTLVENEIFKPFGAVEMFRIPFRKISKPSLPDEKCHLCLSGWSLCACVGAWFGMSVCVRAACFCWPFIHSSSESVEMCSKAAPLAAMHRARRSSQSAAVHISPPCCVILLVCAVAPESVCFFLHARALCVSVLSSFAVPPHRSLPPLRED